MVFISLLSISIEKRHLVTQPFTVYVSIFASLPFISELLNALMFVAINSLKFSIVLHPGDRYYLQ